MSPLGALDHGAQVLLIFNRRGFAPFTQCRQCRAAITCPNCRVSLVHHLHDHALLCHYCGYRIPPPDLGPACNAPELRLSSSGHSFRGEEQARRAKRRR